MNNLIPSHSETVNLRAALEYASKDWPVFPLYAPRENGICSCGKGDCDKPGKHPRTTHGLNDATTDPEQIRKWWGRWPDANIAAKTGPESGVFVVDIDGPEGEKSLDTLTKEHGPLPETWQARTGRGQHAYLKYPVSGTAIRNSSGRLGKGIDVRGDGGYIIVPPSLHPSGRRYEWNAGQSPDDIPIADAPPWLLNLVKAEPSSKNESPPVQDKQDLSLVLTGVPEGERDEAIFKYACSRRALGISRGEIEAWALESARNCTPAFPEKEALQKVEQAFKYAGPEHTDLEGAREQVRGLVAKPDDLQRIFGSESIGALALVRDQDPAMWNEFKRTAKGLVKDVEKQIRKRRLSVVSAADGFQLATVGTLLAGLGITPPDGTEEFVLPGKYVFDEQGTGYLEHTEDGPKRRAVAPTYLLISQKMTDMATGEETLRLCFRAAEEWKNITVARGDAVVSRRCVDLADRGYPIGSHNAPEIARYHFEFETANRDTIATERISSALGWMHQKGHLSFMWGRRHITDGNQGGVITFKGADVGDEQIATGYRQAGSFEGWISAIERVKGFPRVMVNIYASHTPPLLRIIDASNFGVDNTCKTSAGKTSAQRSAASVWGNPDEASPDSCVHTWDLTPVAVERICGVASDLPVFLDDSKRAKKVQDISQILYSIISGQGRGRGSIRGLRRTRTWKTVLLSTGEAPAVSYSQDAGIRARIITVRGLPFGKDDQETAEIVAALDSGVKANYGHAGPMFVEWLLRYQDKWEDFRRQHDELRRGYQGTEGPASRIGAMVAAIALTGRLVHQALSLPWQFQNPFDSLWSSIAADLENVHIDVRALQDLVSWACSNEESFFGRHEIRVFRDGMGDVVDTHEKTPPRGWSGRWDRGNGWEFIALYPHVLREILERAGYRDYDAIISGWRERDWLDAPQRDTYTKTMRVGSERRRLVVIRREAFPDMAQAEDDDLGAL